jgi:hypothetical protein
MSSQTALDGFRCSGEQGKTARGETLSSRLQEGVAKAALCGRKEIARPRVLAWLQSMRQRRGDGEQFTPVWQIEVGESYQKHGVFQETLAFHGIARLDLG